MNEPAQPAARTSRELSSALTAPFPLEAVHFLPLTIKGNRALAAAYLDARAIMDRLDQVFGVGGWKDDYEVLSGGSVVSRLSVRIGGEWVQKCDIGSPSEQPDQGDKVKAAFSDSLKRAAIKLGIGRYLYRLPRQWVDYDPQKKQFTKTPQLPDWALPAKGQQNKKPLAPVAPPAVSAPNGNGNGKPIPVVIGAALLKRITDQDHQLSQGGVCRQGALLEAVSLAGHQRGLKGKIEDWPEAGFHLACDVVRDFKNRVAAPPGRDRSPREPGADDGD